ncbi:YciI family protein [Piscinibacter sakaiensis]|uniref:Mlr4612 protein n=1 Tax=Piscinibacter sakaiensis TaxID=1547922 RepID=A0A0K8NYA1_PISS1|nr:YciI family protein [Piscinibacter sakaiensis]GAP35361.1 Mlr4612 protein [Piscinibacter sakaiensis]
MPHYLLLLHETPATYAELGPEEMRALVERYRAWSAALAGQGRLVGGEKLADDGGRHLRRAEGRPLATDGPYAEAHDVVGGYFTIEAADAAEAEALATDCPHLAHPGNWIEIRRIDALT